MFLCLAKTAVAATAGEITSVYDTHLGTITLTWSRSSLGVFLLADLILPPPPSSPAIADHFRLRFRPYLTWNRKGSKHYHFKSAADRRRRVVSLAWDLSLATFSGGRGPEPAGEFFLSISVDGEIALTIGDRKEEAFRLISRRERVRFGGFGGEVSYATKVRFEGKEMEVTILIDFEGGEMRVGIDGEVVLEVRRICWKFRGVDGGVLKNGGRIEVAWDVHDWFFREEGGEGEGVFVLRFEREEGGEGKIRGGCGGCVWKRDWSDSSGGSWSGSGSSVEEMECCEEAELWGSDEGGFTLIVCGRKG